MAVRYTVRDGELVSVQLNLLLEKAEQRSGHNTVAEGHRTRARQQFFWDCGPNGCCCCNNCNLAAPVSDDAPHILTGRAWHALDMADGARAERDFEALGVNAWRTVPGEDWHVQVDGNDLLRFWNENKADRWEALPDHIENDVRKLFMHRNTARDLDHAIVEIRAGTRRVKNKKATLRRLEKKLAAHKGWRRHFRRKVEQALKRSTNRKTKRLLRRALDATPNR